MDILPSNTDPCLLHAHAQWRGPLQQGRTLADNGDYSAALTPLAEAIRISGSFHPLFHFLESGLNTELAALHLQHGEWAEAERLFDRAVFLHHDNAVALQGKALAQAEESAPLPAYQTRQLAALLTPKPTADGIHALYRQAHAADKAEAIALSRQAIELCESTHRMYHRAAALPWLCRAECFAAQGEDLLARNDIRHGMDLDRENAELLALSVRLAA